MNTSQPTDFDRQYRALRGGRSVAELAGWTSISVTGADRAKFLQNFCTNDVMRLVPGGACEAFFLNVKGKIVGHGLLTCRSEELVIVGPPGQVAQLVEHLDRYIIREDVQLRDSTSDRHLLVSGAPADVSSVSFAWNLIGNDSARIFEAATSEMPLLERIHSDRSFHIVERAVFDTARIETGVPLFGIDFTSENLPQEVGRDRQAISFTKGCYLGQETVARIDALGHVNRRIVGVRFFGDELPQSGTELSRAGAAVGRVTSAAYSPTLSAPLALAMVRRDTNTLGTRLNSVVGECDVIELPLSQG